MISFVELLLLAAFVLMLLEFLVIGSVTVAVIFLVVWLLQRLRR